MKTIIAEAGVNHNGSILKAKNLLILLKNLELIILNFNYLIQAISNTKNKNGKVSIRKS